jgi:hypothetical protein
VQIRNQFIRYDLVSFELTTLYDLIPICLQNYAGPADGEGEEMADADDDDEDTDLDG